MQIEPRLTQTFETIEKDDSPLNINSLHPATQGSCGYCHREQTAISMGFRQMKMCPQSYLRLIERGWRRSGSYLYKHNMAKNCCQMWTIRTDVTQFDISREQKKTVRAAAKLFLGTTFPINSQPKTTPNNQKHTPPQYLPKPNQDNKPLADKTKPPEEIPQQFKAIANEIALKVEGLMRQSFTHLIPAELIVHHQSIDFSNLLPRLKVFVEKERKNCDFYCNLGMLLFGCNKKFFSKDLNLQKFVLLVKQPLQTELRCQAYSVELEKGGFLLVKLENTRKTGVNPANNIKRDEITQLNGLKCPPNSQKVSKQKLKNAIGEEKAKNAMDEEKQHISSSDIPPLKFIESEMRFGNLLIKIKRSDVRDQDFELYKIYCQNIHGKDTQTRDSYRGFLGVEPLFNSQRQVRSSRSGYKPKWTQTQQLIQRSQSQGDTAERPPQQNIQDEETINLLQGCYHFLYYFGGQLIGLGVCDMLPTGLSSVYFFYDPKLKPYRLGVFSTLVELEYVRRIQHIVPSFKYYYMGYYLPGCQKMNYKLDYGPCEILCPITYKFILPTAAQLERIKNMPSGPVDPNHLRLASQEASDEQQCINPQQFIKDKFRLKISNRVITLNQLGPAFKEMLMKILTELLQNVGRSYFGNIKFICPDI